ncbi:hypothetical protein ABPG72_017831 [Tetrahymena utriculariae]
MEQQNSSFYNLKDFKKSNLKALTIVDLQLKNQTLDDKQLTQLNNSLKKCSNLESLILNLQKESISDEQINSFFEYYQSFRCSIPTCNSMSNDQRYSHMKFLLEACNQSFDEISIKHKQNEIGVYGNILKEDVISNLINLKQLELNLNFNESNGSGASYFVLKLTELAELITLKINIYDTNNLIEDEQYCNMARFISKIVKLKTLVLKFRNYEKFLKTSELINCRNIKILNLSIDPDLPQITKRENIRLAQNIKRLVKLELNYDY